jgi:hypothetical protein
MFLLFRTMPSVEEDPIATMVRGREASCGAESKAAERVRWQAASDNPAESAAGACSTRNETVHNAHNRRIILGVSVTPVETVIF